MALGTSAVAVLVLAAACSLPVEAADEEGAVAVRRVRALDVSVLEAGLPSQTLEAWLAEVATPGFSKPTWQYDNCGRAKGLEPGTALCVRGTARAELERGAVDVAVDIRVGSIGGPPTRPSTYVVEVWVLPRTAQTTEAFDAVFDFHESAKLSELPRLIAQGLARARHPKRAR